MNDLNEPSSLSVLASATHHWYGLQDKLKTLENELVTARTALAKKEQALVALRHEMDETEARIKALAKRL